MRFLSKVFKIRLRAQKNSLLSPLRPFLFAFIAMILSCFMYALPAQASCGCINNNCSSGDCSAASNYVQQRHDDIYNHTTGEFDDDLEAFEDWFVEDFLYDQVMPALGLLVNQMNAVAMQYTQAVGMFLDAKNQMDTQQLYQKLKFEAHRDYQLSDGFCTFGSGIRSMAGSAALSDLSSRALGRYSISRQLGLVGMAGSESGDLDLKSRWAKFVHLYCNPKDNNRIRPGVPTATSTLLLETEGTGLQWACDHDGAASGSATGGDEPERFNKDIDYTRLIEDPRTLEVDFSDNSLSGTGSFGTMLTLVGDEEDVLELSKNLYGSNVLTRNLIDRDALATSETLAKRYFLLRSIAAKRSVAQNSFNAIVGLKSRGTSAFSALSDSLAGAPPVGVTFGSYTLYPTQAYLAAIVREVLPVANNNSNVNEDCDPHAGTINNFCIYKIIGMRPSYYSQLEIMAKRIYQNPDFYAQLYESVANVERKKVAMKAIELMVDREMYESQLRKEMLVSVLLSSKLTPVFRKVNAELSKSDGGKK